VPPPVDVGMSRVDLASGVVGCGENLLSTSKEVSWELRDRFASVGIYLWKAAATKVIIVELDIDRGGDDSGKRPVALRGGMAEV
jgi:hypothetical protein